jgi:hypothetical protein
MKSWGEDWLFGTWSIVKSIAKRGLVVDSWLDHGLTPEREIIFKR